MRPRWPAVDRPRLWSQRETVKSFRVAAPIFLQREPEQLPPGPSRERRARIRKDGPPTRKSKESPSYESHNDEGLLRGGGRLKGALGDVCSCAGAKPERKRVSSSTFPTTTTRGSTSSSLG